MVIDQLTLIERLEPVPLSMWVGSIPRIHTSSVHFNSLCPWLLLGEFQTEDAIDAPMNFPGPRLEACRACYLWSSMAVEVAVLFCSQTSLSDAPPSSLRTTQNPALY